MQLDEIKDRYKALPIAARVALMAVLGLLPGAYIYLEEEEALSAELVSAQGQLDAARIAFEKASKDKSELPKLEEQLAFTEEQLNKAKKKLPDYYHIEEVLEKTATIAREVGVELVNFKPKQESCKEVGGVRYMELLIETKIEGRFAQLAAFMDRVVHLEMSVFVRDIDVKLATNSQTRRARDASLDAGSGSRTPAEQARLARQNIRTESLFDLAIYRVASDSEACAGAQPTQTAANIPPVTPNPRAPQPAGR